jgi:hypothetical protein
MAGDETHFYTTIKTCKSTPGPLRPSVEDLETQLRKKA